MTDNNASIKLPQTEPSQNAITLDSVIRTMQDWRSNKQNRQEPIPDKIWNDIFLLLDTFPEATLRAVLGITPIQFERKIAERSQTPIPSTKEVAYVDFVKLKHQSLFISPLKFQQLILSS